MQIALVVCFLALAAASSTPFTFQFEADSTETPTAFSFVLAGSSLSDSSLNLTIDSIGGCVIQTCFSRNYIGYQAEGLLTESHGCFHRTENTVTNAQRERRAGAIPAIPAGVWWLNIHINAANCSVGATLSGSACAADRYGPACEKIAGADVGTAVTVDPGQTHWWSQKIPPVGSFGVVGSQVQVERNSTVRGSLLMSKNILPGTSAIGTFEQTNLTGSVEGISYATALRGATYIYGARNEDSTPFQVTVTSVALQNCAGLTRRGPDCDYLIPALFFPGDSATFPIIAGNHSVCQLHQSWCYFVVAQPEGKSVELNFASNDAEQVPPIFIQRAEAPTLGQFDVRYDSGDHFDIQTGVFPMTGYNELYIGVDLLGRAGKNPFNVSLTITNRDAGKGVPGKPPTHNPAVIVAIILGVLCGIGLVVVIIILAKRKRSQYQSI